MHNATTRLIAEVEEATAHVTMGSPPGLRLAQKLAEALRLQEARLNELEERLATLVP